MIKDEVARCLKKHDRSINWLAKELGVSWTAVKDKLNRDTFTGNEFLDLCAIFDDFDYEKLIEDRKLKSLEYIDDDEEIRISISGDKIGTLCKNMGWQSFADDTAEDMFNKAIPELSMSIKKSLVIEREIFKEMDLLGLKYSVNKID